MGRTGAARGPGQLWDQPDTVSSPRSVEHNAPLARRPKKAKKATGMVYVMGRGGQCGRQAVEGCAAHQTHVLALWWLGDALRTHTPCMLCTLRPSPGCLEAAAQRAARAGRRARPASCLPAPCTDHRIVALSHCCVLLDLWPLGCCGASCVARIMERARAPG